MTLVFLYRAVEKLVRVTWPRVFSTAVQCHDPALAELPTDNERLGPIVAPIAVGGVVEDQIVALEKIGVGRDRGEDCILQLQTLPCFE